MSKETIERRLKFENEWEKLSTTQQSVLQLMCVAYEPLSQTNLLKCITEASIPNPSNYTFSAKDLKLLLLDLERAGWIEGHEKNTYGIHSQYENILMKELCKSKYLLRDYSAVVRRVMPLKQYNSVWYPPRSFDAAVRELRLALYANNIKEYDEALRSINTHFSSHASKVDLIGHFFNNPFDPEWMKSLVPEMQIMAIEQLFLGKLNNLSDFSEILNYLKTHPSLTIHASVGNVSRSVTAWALLYTGQINDALNLLKKHSENRMVANAGGIALVTGDYANALPQFDVALKILRDTAGSRKAFWNSHIGVMHTFAMISDEKLRDYNKYSAIITGLPPTAGALIFQQFLAIFHYFGNRTGEAHALLHRIPIEGLPLLVHSIMCYWTQYHFSSEHLIILKTTAKKAHDNGWLWFAFEFYTILSKVLKEPRIAEEYAQMAASLAEETGLVSLTELVKKTEAWERSLEALMRAASPANIKGTKTKGTAKDTRMIWLVDFEESTLQPIEQSLGKDGSWSKGRNIALKRLKEGAVECASRQDQQIAACIKQVNYGYYGGTQYEIDTDKAIGFLVGHPLMFLLKSPNIACELVEKQLELLIEEKQGQYEVRLSHDLKNPNTGPLIVRETNTRYNLIQVKKEHLSISMALGGKALRVPLEAKDRLVAALQGITSIITIQSEVAVQDNEQIESVTADDIIHAHMLPVGDGFKLELFVKPFKDNPPYLRPGSGRENVFTEVQGVKLRAVRNLAIEKQHLDEVIAACPILSNTESYDEQWSFEGSEQCLQALLEIDPLRQSKQLVLEWPKGERFRVTHKAEWSQFGLKIDKQNDWFSINGELKLSESLVLTMEQLMLLTQASPNSNFIEISDGHFIALTKQFQKKLKEMEAFVQKNKKGGYQFHPLASAAMEDISDGLGSFHADKTWLEYTKKLREAKQIKAEVPSTYQAELRGYQFEGFQWLMQLAHWGVGACLADDMGLGKTIQAMAVILARASEGPALVVAPSSVSINWMKEVLKFAPTLNPIQFGKGDRKQVMDDLKPFDLLICSYGLMQQEGEMFSKQNFSTIILDEAQAIKNFSAKRTQAAMELQGGFKIITTGTPIENHLGELWSLFNFINPGLLGAIGQFNERFATPIEKFNDKDRRIQLKKLIQPFVLRRRKNEVLDELPSKTEITLSVQLSDEERAFYEALRRNAIKSLESSPDENSGTQRLRILAEIMKLRQACCNPNLVDSKLGISSSKLTLFGEVVEELLENDHKALVFSQFVGHLRIIEEYVKKKGIRYQYLDGSTPLKKREEMINAFQRGDGDLFLISLKAGGVGLNLTAADYVLHMDPWWNPAVEDQASDRAHRIGQQRPVTIYRLITEQTIEEKIVNLHATKRDLADSLLEGTDGGIRMNADDLMRLLKEGL